MRGFTAAGAEAQRALETRFRALPSAAAIERWHRYFTREPHVGHLAAHQGDRRVHRRRSGGRRASTTSPSTATTCCRRIRAACTSRWWRRDATCRRCARIRIPRIPTRRNRRSAARGRRSPPRATSPRRSSTPTAATRPTTTLLRAQRHRPEGQDRHRPLLESVQLPRVQGAHRRARRRGGDDRLLGSGRGRLRQGRGVPEGPVGTGQPPAARRHRLRLHRAGRSADARLGVDRRARGGSPSSEAVSIPKVMALPMSHRDIQPILEALGGPPAPDGVEGRPADHLSARRRTPGCTCRSTCRPTCSPTTSSRAASAAASGPTSGSCSATTTTRGCSAASIRRAARRR